MKAIETTGLTKRYKDITAVDALDLTVEQGELLALLGVNGAGKSTAIRMLCCLTEPTSGDARILGHSIRTERAAVRQKIAVSPQETAVAPNLTVLENLRFMAGIYGFARKEATQKANEIAEKLGLHTVLQRRAGKLSGGWQRRLSLALALIGEPEVLFLDEPTLGLDILARSELWDCIRALRGKVTIVLTTHYMEEARTLADRIAVLQEGRLRFIGTTEDLYAKTGTENFEEAFLRVVKEEVQG